MPTNQTAQTLASKDVDAIGAWQPNAGQALKAVAGSKAIFTSADVPGLIYDLVSVNPKSLSTRRDDWVKVVKVWNRTVAFVTDPENKAEAVKIMAGRAGVPPEEYARFLPGTHFLTPAGGARALRQEGRPRDRSTGRARSPTRSTSRTRSTPNRSRSPSTSTARCRVKRWARLQAAAQ